ncbi:hypothetical protein SLEP1_g30346 [Rubroshorea leprosula]|uniref:Uncharacterized protein n=1 Tax=Rubroshorea leprosula TaxID=152421 RepID=A0AAV5K5Q6_9ROSI|nr:hypothetical protein SLEP1_g30346 [Rubroshorea leprosula]
MAMGKILARLIPDDPLIPLLNRDAQPATVVATRNSPALSNIIVLTKPSGSGKLNNEPSSSKHNEELLKHELELPSSKARCKTQAQAAELKGMMQSSNAICRALKHDELEHDLPSMRCQVASILPEVELNDMEHELQRCKYPTQGRPERYDRAEQDPNLHLVSSYISVFLELAPRPRQQMSRAEQDPNLHLMSRAEQDPNLHLVSSYISVFLEPAPRPRQHMSKAEQDTNLHLLLGSKLSLSAFSASWFSVVTLSFLVPGRCSHLIGWKSQIKSNGQVKSTNKIVLRALKTRVLAAHSNWVNKLNKVLWSCRTTPSSASGETPFNLTYGAEAVIPVEVGLPSDRAGRHNDPNNEQLLRENLDLVEEVREMFRIRNMAHQSRVTNAYSYMGKLAPKWEGPYMIIHVKRPRSAISFRGRAQSAKIKHELPRSTMSCKGRARSAELKHELTRSNTSCRAQTLAVEAKHEVQNLNTRRRGQA